ncbi:MAG TPA: class I SAM-dependent methyltransferase [Acidimicrobiales bacterium]|nr:class I SAM-dependent methyltransferase [Acidimicrobiales bacterium]
MTTLDTPPIDEERVGAFAERLLGAYTGSFVTFMIDLGHRTGLFDAAARGPATSGELADRAGLQERYVREWLGAVVTAGIVDYDPTTGRYTLPAEHAVCLTGTTDLNMAPLSAISGHLAPFIGPVAQSFRDGGGVPYEAYRPDFTRVMDGLSRPMFDTVLVDQVLPLAGGLVERLRAGTRVADIGCGTGHSTNVLAGAFPASTFVGYDLAADGIEVGRAEASERGLDNVTFAVQDVLTLPTDPPLGAAFAFDAIHDQADPAGVLARVFEALEPGGIFVMFDIRASSHLERNVDNPLAPMLYAISTLHCMTVSLACGGAGLGTVWGEELALEMLAAAGFVDVTVDEAPGDPLDSVYVARKPA